MESKLNRIENMGVNGSKMTRRRHSDNSSEEIANLEFFLNTRIFDGPLKVIGTDGSHSETFVRGERVKNVQRTGKRLCSIRVRNIAHVLECFSVFLVPRKLPKKGKHFRVSLAVAKVTLRQQP
jgi:hypothetical protein